MAEGKSDNQEIIELLKKISGKGDRDRGRAEDKKAASESKNQRKKVKDALISNTVGLLGLTKSMFTLAGLAGDQKAMNAKLSQNLGQVAMASLGSKSAMERFQKGQQGAQQAIDAFADAVDLGMTKFSDSSLQFAAQLKVLGVQNKAAMGLMRANTQGLGISQETSLQLADELVSTAAANKDSIAGLISAINSMKDAMLQTTVELGPKAAANAQKIAAMMSQGNTELQESSAKFVSSFLAGSDGYMKAAKLGVQFTGQESTAEMAGKFEEILAKIGTMQSGKAGAGSQFMFDALEKSFGLSRDDFNLQQQIGSQISDLVQGSTEGLAAQTSQISLQQAYDNATFAFQSSLLEMTEGAAGALNDLGSKLAGWLVPIMAGIGVMAGLFPLLAMKIGKGVVKGIWTPFKWLGKTMLKGLNGLGGKLANKLFGVKNAIMKTTGKKVAGAAAASAVKAGSAVAIQKGFLKGLVKKIPLIGAVAGAGFAVSRAMKGDWTGAAMELASGVASTIPGVGTAASIGIDAALIAKDLAGNPTGKVADSAGGALAASVADEGDSWEAASLEVQQIQAAESTKTTAAADSIAANTRESLDIQKAQLESSSPSNPLIQISNQLAMNMIAMNDLIGLTAQGNDQRLEGNDERQSANPKNQPLGPIGANK